MAIPDYQSLMLPLLKLASDSKEYSVYEAVEILSKKFKLTEKEEKEMLPSGQQTIIFNRIAWAKTYLKKAGLMEIPQRGKFKITQRGLDVLASNPTSIDNKLLSKFDEFVEFKTKKKKRPGYSNKTLSENETPEEAFELAYENLKSELISEILQNLKNCPPQYFEKIVVEVLVKMGYGGSIKDAGKAVGRSGDEGIDGIIKEDRLGLDIIYVQAKRWENVVGRPEIQKFAGALQGQRAKKGIFITTSTFTKDAIEFVSKIDSKIILIDGNNFAEYMIDFNVGVSVISTFEIKKIDIDYFIDN